MKPDGTEKIFFYCFPQGPPERAAYQHGIVCLAEGLKELGIPFYANINYWKTSLEGEEFLFNFDPKVTPDDCSIVVTNHCWFCYGNSIPDNLFHPNRNYCTVYLDAADGNRTHSWNREFRQFDLIFKAHYNQNCLYPSNVKPWAFGLSNRIIQETNYIGDFKDRKKQLLVNFRVSHSLRKVVSDKFFPVVKNLLEIDNSFDSFNPSELEAYQRLQWEQTGRRHYPSYYQRLKEFMACASFGGRFVSPLPQNQATLIGQALSLMFHKLSWESKRILQWDSWRFWESLAAGCVTFHLDFDKYGLVLPAMPKNWEHYIGIDLDDSAVTVDRISRNPPELLEKISLEGRKWALENYSPVPTALRFLETIKSWRES